jgi:hypothetical protein
MPIKDRAYRKFCATRQNAKARGIGFDLTFAEWSVLWLSFGRFLAMGKRKGRYVLARFGDVGSYALGNVKIITAEQNHREQNQNPATRAKQIARVKRLWQQGIYKSHQIPTRIWTQQGRVEQAARVRGRDRDYHGRWTPP